MAYRKRMNRKQSKRNFRRGARVKKRNLGGPRPMRGGYRL